MVQGVPSARIHRRPLVSSFSLSLAFSLPLFSFSPVRKLIDDFSEIPDSLPLQVEVVQELIDWATAESRIFLKQNLQTRLVALFLDNRMYTDALSLIAVLLKELKRLDDKMVLVEVQLLESRCYHALRNLPKSKVAERVGNVRTRALASHIIGTQCTGCSHVWTHLGQCHLLSASSSSCTRLAVGHSAC